MIVSVLYENKNWKKRRDWDLKNSRVRKSVSDAVTLGWYFKGTPHHFSSLLNDHESVPLMRTMVVLEVSCREEFFWGGATPSTAKLEPVWRVGRIVSTVLRKLTFLIIEWMNYRWQLLKWSSQLGCSGNYWNQIFSSCDIIFEVTMKLFEVNGIICSQWNWRNHYIDMAYVKIFVVFYFIKDMSLS